MTAPDDARHRSRRRRASPKRDERIQRSVTRSRWQFETTLSQYSRRPQRCKEPLEGEIYRRTRRSLSRREYKRDWQNIHRPVAKGEKLGLFSIPKLVAEYYLYQWFKRILFSKYLTNKCQELMTIVTRYSYEHNALDFNKKENTIKIRRIIIERSNFGCTISRVFTECQFTIAVSLKFQETLLIFLTYICGYSVNLTTSCGRKQ